MIGFLFYKYAKILLMLVCFIYTCLLLVVSVYEYIRCLTSLINFCDDEM